MKINSELIRNLLLIIFAAIGIFTWMILLSGVVSKSKVIAGEIIVIDEKFYSCKERYIKEE